ncbi:MAG TPA: aspartate 1-decarboxylase [Chloroflexia bacterium]|nr:aspartate 1-decarboxylase [Chloroflexia bacterium]
MAVYRFMVRSKIHRATVTAADLHYVGSITIDTVLLEAADILPYEKVQVVDVTNGNRFETYAIEGEPGSGAVQVNGAAAHLVSVGDTIIIMSYAQVEEPVPANWRPRVVLVGNQNMISEVRPLPQSGLSAGAAYGGDGQGGLNIDIEALAKDLMPSSNVKFRD